MDRGFPDLNFIQELDQSKKYFVLRIKNNWKLEFDAVTGLGLPKYERRFRPWGAPRRRLLLLLGDLLVKISSSIDAQSYRVINFCDLETKVEFRLVTNLPVDGNAGVTDDEIRDIYRLRWGV